MARCDTGTHVGKLIYNLPDYIVGHPGTTLMPTCTKSSQTTTVYTSFVAPTKDSWTARYVPYARSPS